MHSNSDPLPSPHIAPGWVLGTTVFSICCLIIWGIDLVRGPSAPLASPGRIGFFWGFLLVYSIVLTTRVWVTLVPPQRNVRYWHRNMGLLYWLVTLPLLWYIGAIVLFWNGVPGV